MGASVSQDGVAVHPDCWCVCLCYLHFALENREDGKQRYDCWHPTCLRKQQVRYPSRMQHNSVLWCRVVLMMTLELTDCGKAGDFGSVPGMLCADEVVGVIG